MTARKPISGDGGGASTTSDPRPWTPSHGRGVPVVDLTRTAWKTAIPRGRCVLDMNLRLAVLGDSIAYGVGADHPSHTLAQRLRAALTLHGIDLDPHVFAVPGARSAGLAGQVRRALAWQPHVAVTVIGANDLTHLVPHDQATRQLRDAVRALRGRDVEVVVAPAPDLSIVPHVPPMMRPVVQAGSLALRSAQIRAVLDEGGLVADSTAATSDAFLRDRSLFSSDRFHPSSAGYALIAGVLTPVVLAAARVAADRRDAAEQTEQTG